MEEQQLLQQLEQVLTGDNNLLAEIDDALGLNSFPDGAPPPPHGNQRAPTPGGGGGSGMLQSMLNNSNQAPMSSQQSMMPRMSSSPRTGHGIPTGWGWNGHATATIPGVVRFLDGHDGTA